MTAGSCWESWQISVPQKGWSWAEGCPELHSVFLVRTAGLSDGGHPSVETTVWVHIVEVLKKIVKDKVV